MTARTQFYALLEEHLPEDVVLLPYARDIDPPAKPTVMVRIDQVAPSTVAGGLRDYRFGLVLVAAKTTAGPGDDELDGLLEDVLFALEQASSAGITWSTANRATYKEANPAYEVTASVTINKE